MRYILGLDISTSVVGYTVIDENKKLHNLSYIKLSNEKDLFVKADIVKDVLYEYEGLITDVAIEEPLVMYKEGFSRAQILSKLSTFNGMISIMSKFIYNTTPMYYNVNTARKLSFPNVKFPKGCDRKELMRQAVAEMYPEVDWPLMAKGKNIGQPRKECFDMSDSCVIALAHLEKIKGDK